MNLLGGLATLAHAQDPAAIPSVEEIPTPLMEATIPGTGVTSPVAPIVPEYRVLSSLRNDSRFQRTWSRTYSSETDVMRHSRKTRMVDHQQHRLQAEVQVIGAGPQFRVHVLQARATPSAESRGVDHLPAPGSVLICTQASTGRVNCFDELAESAVEWPAWAPLDLNPWMTSAPIQPNYRWRRTVMNAEQLGWLNADSESVRVSLGISNGSIQAASIATMSGNVVANAHTSILGMDLPYEIVGTINATFDPSQQVLSQVEIHLNSQMSHSGSAHGVPFTWTRDVSTQLTIATESL